MAGCLKAEALRFWGLAGRGRTMAAAPSAVCVAPAAKVAGFFGLGTSFARSIGLRNQVPANGRFFVTSMRRDYAYRDRDHEYGSGRRKQEFNVRSEKFGIKIERNVIAERLHEYRLSSFKNKWTCKPSKFPWKYDSNEIMYLLKGKVNIYPDGENDYVQIIAGDIVIMPQGMSCTWDVLDDVEKMYKLYI